MPIPKPRYELGQEVFLLQSSGIKPVNIHAIIASASVSSKTKISYKVATKGGSLSEFDEIRIFNSKVDAAYSWLKDQRLDPGQILQGFLAMQKQENKDEKKL